MRVIGVLDLRNGRAVHARAGRRDEYPPIRTVAGRSIPEGDAVALARIYRDRFDIGELYAADLDAIRGNNPHEDLAARLVALGLPLWLDAGIHTPAQAARALWLGAWEVIVSLETLPSWDALRAVSDLAGPPRVAFSLDLVNGAPKISGDRVRRESPETIATRAADAGAQSVIVIDLSRVGESIGPDLDLIDRVRAAVPDRTLIVGGGIGNEGHLKRLASSGCDGVLLATALHNGRLDADAIRSLGTPPPTRPALALPESGHTR